MVKRVAKRRARGKVAPGAREDTPKKYTRAELEHLRSLPTPPFDVDGVRLVVAPRVRQSEELEWATLAVSARIDAADARELSGRRARVIASLAAQQNEVATRALANTERRSQGKREKHSKELTEIYAEVGAIWRALTAERGRPPLVNEALDQFRMQTKGWKRRGTTLRTFQRYLAAARLRREVPER